MLYSTRNFRRTLFLCTAISAALMSAAAAGAEGRYKQTRPAMDMSLDAAPEARKPIGLVPTPRGEVPAPAAASGDNATIVQPEAAAVPAQTAVIPQVAPAGVAQPPVSEQSGTYSVPYPIRPPVMRDTPKIQKDAPKKIIKKSARKKEAEKKIEEPKVDAVKAAPVEKPQPPQTPETPKIEKPEPPKVEKPEPPKAPGTAPSQEKSAKPTIGDLYKEEPAKETPAAVPAPPAAVAPPPIPPAAPVEEKKLEPAPAAPEAPAAQLPAISAAPAVPEPAKETPTTAQPTIKKLGETGKLTIEEPPVQTPPEPELRTEEPGAPPSPPAPPAAAPSPDMPALPPVDKLKSDAAKIQAPSAKAVPIVPVDVSPEENAPVPTAPVPPSPPPPPAPKPVDKSPQAVLDKEVAVPISPSPAESAIVAAPEVTSTEAKKPEGDKKAPLGSEKKLEPEKKSEPEKQLESGKKLESEKEETAPAVETADKTPPAKPASDPLEMSVAFKVTETTLPLSVKPQLDALAKKLAKDEALRVTLTAYASAAGDQASTARRVSLSRALAVRAYLIDQGVANLRINVQAEGDKNPGGEPDRVDIALSKPEKK